MSDVIKELLNNQLIVINIGLRTFAESLEKQAVDFVQVDWTPPADGDQEMIDLLSELVWSMDLWRFHY